MTLKNVKEYNEGFDVEIKKISNADNRICVIAKNEGGYNGVSIDAKQLYEALKEYFEKGE